MEWFVIYTTKYARICISTPLNRNDCPQALQDLFFNAACSIYPRNILMFTIVVVWFDIVDMKVFDQSFARKLHADWYIKEQHKS